MQKQDTTDTTDLNYTVRIPEEVKTQTFSLKDLQQQELKFGKHRKKVHRHSTTVHTVLDHIFSQEEQHAVEALSIQADSSLEFRDKLALSGNKYKIEKLLATGGFGKIFQVEDRVLGRKAVVKTLKEEFLQDDKAVEHFIAEAKLNSQLDHPGIVPLFSLDTDSNKGLHLAMQKVTGITLKEYVERSRALLQKHHFAQKLFSKMLTERLEIFLRICDTIAYCHERGILHNDLKPNNIMIGRHGQVYVMDWGIASIIGEEKPKQNVGSPAYMAPERLCSNILSMQTDIFSLGMILNELVTLRPSMEDSSVTNIVERICTGQFDPSTCVEPRRHISVILRAIIEKARDPNPQERYAFVGELSEDIRRFLMKEETSAYPDSVIQMIFRFLFHHHRIALSFVAVLVFLAIGAVGYNFYNTGLITEKANQETLWKLSLVKSVDTKSDIIGKRLLLLQEQTTNMGAALSIEYGKKIYDSNAPFYWNEDFMPGSKHRPPELIHTIASRGKAITLATGTFYRFRDEISQQEIQDWANNFRAQQSQHFANVLAHIHERKSAYKADKLKQLYEYGSTVQRIICVLDNGLVYCYPGKFEDIRSKNAFVPGDANRELRTGKKFAWSSPYLDPASGQILISSWHTIDSMRGNKMGVIGMVVIYEDILHDFLEQIRQDNDKHAIYTLVDSEAHVIYSSAREFEPLQTQTDSYAESMIGHHSYKWYSEVIRRIRKNPAQNQFTVILNKTPFNITWKKVPSSNWLLIQHIPLDKKDTMIRKQEAD